MQQLKYVQKTGHLYADGKLIGLCYSGCGEGLNHPASQAIHNVGPIPRGQYGVARIDEPRLGPVVFGLTPLLGEDIFGRDSFRIHWDNKAADFTGSTGCIVGVMPAMFDRITAPGLLTVVEDE